MEAEIGSQLGMEGGGEEAALAGGHGCSVRQAGQHFDSGPYLFDDRGADENGMIGSAFAQFWDGEIRLE